MEIERRPVLALFFLLNLIKLEMPLCNFHTVYRYTFYVLLQFDDNDSNIKTINELLGHTKKKEKNILYLIYYLVSKPIPKL
jgi:hypothetical protein